MNNHDDSRVKPPVPPLPNPDSIPASLHASGWVLWNYYWDKDKNDWTKPPYSPVDGIMIGTDEPHNSHFRSITEALAASKKYKSDGVGRVLVDLVGVDFDNCRDPETGAIDATVQIELPWLANTYGEVSPSGTGLHFIGTGKIPRALDDSLSAARVEVYSHYGRYLTFTGQRFGKASTVFGIQPFIDRIYGKFGKLEPTVSRPMTAAVALKKRQDNHAAFRAMVRPEDSQNNQLNKCAFFDAQAFAAGILEGTEESLKEELRLIAKSTPYCPGIESTLRSGWRKGLNEPLKILSWKDMFHTGSQLAEGDVNMYIEGILPEGVSALGSLSGVGKTWFALSMARALTTGTPFLKVFSVPEIVPVIYLVPENGERALRKRLERLRIPMDDLFYCQTVSDGVCQLDNPYLEAAVKELKTVVFLDTAVRFSESDDENSARQNAKLLATDLFRLLRWGAKAVVCLHHSPKYSGEAEFMTLENALRGTGDLGAMCDAVWALQNDKQKAKNGKDWDYEYLEESQQLPRLFVRCVKPRDFNAAPSFRVLGRPHIDIDGDFRVIAEMDQADLETQIVTAIEKNPKISTLEIRTTFRVGYKRLMKIAESGGWTQNGKIWTRLF